MRNLNITPKATVTSYHHLRHYQFWKLEKSKRTGDKDKVTGNREQTWWTSQALPHLFRIPGTFPSSQAVYFCWQEYLCSTCIPRNTLRSDSQSTLSLALKGWRLRFRSPPSSRLSEWCCTGLPAAHLPQHCASVSLPSPNLSVFSQATPQALPCPDPVICSSGVRTNSCSSLTVIFVSLAAVTDSNSILHVNRDNRQPSRLTQRRLLQVPKGQRRMLVPFSFSLPLQAHQQPNSVWAIYFILNDCHCIKSAK